MSYNNYMKEYFKEKYQELFSQLDIQKNIKEYPDLKLDNITCGSHKELWFKCPKGHSFKKYIFNLCNSQDHKLICPECNSSWNSKISKRTNKQKISRNISNIKSGNLLYLKYPEIFSELDIQKNTEEFPNINLYEISPKSGLNLYWKCPKCGKSYLATPHNRLAKIPRNCPYCSNKKAKQGINDLKTYCEKNNPLLISEWSDKNPNMETFLPFSNKKVFWKCNKCNMEYRSSIYSRVKNNTGCPYCSGRFAIPGKIDLKTLFPDVASQWDYEKNYPEIPEYVKPSSNKKYYWKCPNGHESYLASPDKRTRKYCPTGCPKCGNRHSVPELTIFNIVKKYYDKYTENGKFIDNWEIDIYSPTGDICTEYDGDYYHKNSEDRETSKNIKISEKHNLFRIKETTEKENNLKKDIKYYGDKKVIIFYIYKNYESDEYYKGLSKIIEEIYRITVDYEEYKKEYYKELQRLHGLK